VKVSWWQVLSGLGLCAALLCSCAQLEASPGQMGEADHAGTAEATHSEWGVLSPEGEYDADVPAPYTSRSELQRQLKRLQQHRDELLLSFTERHPDLRLLDAQMEVLRHQIEMAHN